MLHTRILSSFYLFLLIVAGIACPNRATAQMEMWDTYISRIGDKPATIMLDMSLMLTAPDQRYPYLVVTGPQAMHPNKNGIPGAEEIISLESILDATSNFLTGVTAKTLAGTVTYAGFRNNYYYVKDTTGVRNAISRMYNRNFKEYKFSLTIKADPQWLSYRTFLYPDNQTQNWMENNKIITTMLQEGDSLNQPRKISFAACFNTDTAVASFNKYLTSNGYTVDKTTSNKTADMRCIVFSRYGLVKVDSINTTTSALKDEIKKHYGTYSGWNAPLKTK